MVLGWSLVVLRCPWRVLPLGGPWEVLGHALDCLWTSLGCPREVPGGPWGSLGCTQNRQGCLGASQEGPGGPLGMVLVLWGGPGK